MSTPKTVSPASANIAAVARPMPEAAPVTTTTRVWSGLRSVEGTYGRYQRTRTGSRSCRWGHTGGMDENGAARRHPRAAATAVGASVLAVLAALTVPHLLAGQAEAGPSV